MKNEIENIKTKELKKVIQNCNELKQSFGKSKSQWQESTMAINALTPIRNIRHLLARIERSYSACKEAEYRLKKLNIKSQQKTEKLYKEKNKLKKDKLNIEIQEIEHKINSTLYYFSGAVKKIQHNYFCIEQIMKAKGYTKFNEIDFENEEEEFHIKTAINQSIRSVRISGRIDAGNQEYLEQCGVNPTYVQNKIIQYLNDEMKISMTKSVCTMYQFIDELYRDLTGLSAMRSSYLGVQSQFLDNCMYKSNRQLIDKDMYKTIKASKTTQYKRNKRVFSDRNKTS